MAVTTENNRYGVTPTVPTKSLVRSRTEKVLGLNYPIGQNPANSIVGTNINKNNKSNYYNAHSGVNLVRNNLRQLLLTEKGERVMLPDFGLAIRRFLFEPLDEILVRIIRDFIIEGIVKYAKNVKILNLIVRENESALGQLDIVLTVQLKDETREIFDVGVVLK